MKFRRHYFIEERYHGTVDEESKWHRAGHRLEAPIGNVFFCPACSRIWAQTPVEGGWSMCWSVACERHAPGDVVGHAGYGTHTISSFTPPGSLWLAWDDETSPLASFPPSVISRELVIHLRWAAHDRSPFDAGIASAAHALLQSLSATRKDHAHTTAA